jgi:hypothetical protein
LGLGTGKSVGEHLQAIYDNVVLYLKYAEYKHLLDSDIQSGLRMIREDVLFPHGHPSEPSDVLGLYRRIEKWGNWLDGGLSDQPHLLMSEMEICRAAIAHVESTELPYLVRIHMDRPGAQGRT